MRFLPPIYFCWIWISIIQNSRIDAFVLPENKKGPSKRHTDDSWLQGPALAAQHRRQERADSLRVKDPLISLNINLDALAEADAADRAQELYQRIEALYHEGYYPKNTDVVSFNSVMKAWARKKDPQSALAFFSEANVEPNLRSFNTLLLSMAYAGLYEDAERVLQIMKEETLLVPDSICYNTLLLCYRYAPNQVIAKAAAKAEKLLEEMIALDHIKVDLISWNTVLACVSRLGANRALVFMEKMKKNGVQPDLYSYSSIMQIFAKSGDVKQAETIVQEMKQHGMEPNKFILTQLVQAYCRAKAPEKAEEILGSMLADKNTFPDSATFSILIDGFANVVEREPRIIVEKCFELLATMKRLSRKYPNVAPNEKTYTSIIVCLGKSRLWGACHQAKGLLKEFQPSIIHWNALLDAYALSPHADKSLYAYQIWKQMPECDHISYNILIKCASNALGKNAEWREQGLIIAWKAYRELRGHKSANSLTYHYMLKAIRKCCLDEEKKLEMFSTVFNHCCQDGMLSDFILQPFVKSNPQAAERVLGEYYHPKVHVDELLSSWSKNALPSISMSNELSSQVMSKSTMSK